MMRIKFLWNLDIIFIIVCTTMYPVYAAASTQYNNVNIENYMRYFKLILYTMVEKST